MLAAAFLPLTRAAAEAFDADGVAPTARRLERAATLRYRGQSFALTVPLSRADPAGATVPEPATAAPADLVAAFHQAHRARYGYALEREVELVTLRLRAVGKVASLPPPAEPRDDGPVEIARAPLLLDGETHDAPLLLRRRLRPGITVAGPALIAEYSSTTLLPPGARAEVLPSGALSVTMRNDS